MKISSFSPRHSPRDHRRSAGFNGDLWGRLKSASNMSRNIERGKFSTLAIHDAYQQVYAGTGAYFGSMRAATTGFSNVLRGLRASSRWTRMSTASNESCPILRMPGFSYSTTPTTPISSWPRTYQWETEAISSSPAVILNVSITTRPLSLDNSILLLSKVIYGENHVSSQTMEERKRIVETLGCLALAVVQAGAYIRETSCSLQDYLEHLPKHLGTDYQYNVYATWQISVDMIESKPDMVSHHALRLLSLLGFYHQDQIPIQMFYNAWDQSQTTQVADHLPWNDATSDFFDYRQAVQTSINVHPCVMEFPGYFRPRRLSIFTSPCPSEPKLPWSRCRKRCMTELLVFAPRLQLLIPPPNFAIRSSKRVSSMSHIQCLHRA